MWKRERKTAIGNFLHIHATIMLMDHLEMSKYLNILIKDYFFELDLFTGLDIGFKTEIVYMF